MTHLRIPLVLCLLTNAGGLVAQTDSIRQLPATTVRAVRFEQTGYTAWRADSLPADAPLALADRLLWENALPVRANAPGTLATVSARGAGPSRTPVFWNGLNLQSPMHGVVDAALLPLWPGDRVEVRYGGQSAVQSSGAIGGAVLVEPGGDGPAGWSGRAGASAGSFEAYTAQAGLSYNGGRWASQIRATGQRAENDFPFKNTALLGRPEVRQTNNALKRWDVQQFNRLIINEKNVVRSAYWQQKAFREIPPSMTEAATDTWQRDAATRAVATWEHRPNSRSLWQTRAAWLDEAIYFRQFAATDSSRSRTALLTTEYTNRVGDRLTWKTGATALRQWARADGYADSMRWYGQTRLAGFAMAEREGAKGRLSLLLRQEWAERQATPFTWSLGGEWQLGRVGSVRGHLSRNFNLPTFNDRFWLALGQPDLRPEKGYSADAAWFFQKRRFQVELTGFQLIIDDWILWQPGADGQFRPGNLRKVWSRGIEGAAHVQGGVGRWRWKISGRGQVSATTPVAVYGAVQTGKDRQLPYTPQRSASLTLLLRRGGFSGAYLHQFTGRQYTTSDNVDFIPGIQTGQLLLRQSFRLNRRTGLRASLDLRLENVWNTPYQILAYRPMPGRNGRVGVTVFL